VYCYCIKQLCTVVSNKNKNKTNKQRKKETEKENISHKIIVVSSSDLNHRISKSSVCESSSDVIESGSGDAIGAQPSRNKR
jgi:hypothetical protein